METSRILQAIGTEMAALAFLFGMALFAIRICTADRRAAKSREHLTPSSDSGSF